MKCNNPSRSSIYNRPTQHTHNNHKNDHVCTKKKQESRCACDRSFTNRHDYLCVRTPDDMSQVRFWSHNDWSVSCVSMTFVKVFSVNDMWHTCCIKVKARSHRTIYAKHNCSAYFFHSSAGSSQLAILTDSCSSLPRRKLFNVTFPYKKIVTLNRCQHTHIQSKPTEKVHTHTHALAFAYMDRSSQLHSTLNII